MTSANRIRYPIREIQQTELALCILACLRHNYTFAGFISTFCIPKPDDLSAVHEALKLAFAAPGLKPDSVHCE